MSAACSETWSVAISPFVEQISQTVWSKGLQEKNIPERSVS